MNKLDKRFEFEEQVMMRREVANIKASMLQIVEHARLGQLHQMQVQMLHMQMQQMAQRVLMIRERCQHVWEVEHHWQSEFDAWSHERVCIICEARDSEFA